MININIGDIGKNYGWLVVLIVGVIGGIWISHHLHNLIEDQVTKGTQEIKEEIQVINAKIGENETILYNIRDRVASIEGRMERNSSDVQASVAYSPVTGSTL